MINEIMTVTVVCQTYAVRSDDADDVFIAIQGVWWHGQARRTYTSVAANPFDNETRPHPTRHIFYYHATVTATALVITAQLSHRDRAAGCIIVLAKSGRLEPGDNILRILYVYLQPLW